LTPTQQPDRALFIADSSYKLAYDAIAAVMMFEFQQRAELQKVSPKIKTSLDALRPRVVDIDRRWAQARQAYKVNPVPANLNTVQLVLAEIQQLVPVVQSQLAVKQ
jgi:DTW domain-containing protein YfiP